MCVHKQDLALNNLQGKTKLNHETIPFILRFVRYGSVSPYFFFILDFHNKYIFHPPYLVKNDFVWILKFKC